MKLTAANILSFIFGGLFVFVIMRIIYVDNNVLPTDNISQTQTINTVDTSSGKFVTNLSPDEPNITPQKVVKTVKKLSTASPSQLMSDGNDQNFAPDDTVDYQITHVDSLINIKSNISLTQGDMYKHDIQYKLHVPKKVITTQLISPEKTSNLVAGLGMGFMYYPPLKEINLVLTAQFEYKHTALTLMYDPYHHTVGASVMALIKF